MAQLKHAVICTLVVAACGKKDSKDWSSIVKLREDNLPALKAICEPAIALGSKMPPPLTPVTGVSALTSDNATTLTESMALVLAQRASSETLPEPPFLLGAPSFREDDELDNMCGWATANAANRSELPNPFTGDESTDSMRKEIQEILKRVLAKPYVVVIHVTAYDPSLTKDGYVRGRLAAEARIVDNKGVIHGGVAFEATNSDSVKYRQTVDGNGRQLSSDEMQAVHRDLATNAANAFAKALATAVPGSTVTLLAQ